MIGVSYDIKHNEQQLMQIIIESNQPQKTWSSRPQIKD